MSITMGSFSFSDVKLMQVSHRQGGRLIFEDSVPVSNNLPKKIEDMSSYEDCVVWCATYDNCIFFEHIPNTRHSDEGVCTIRFN